MIDSVCWPEWIVRRKCDQVLASKDRYFYQGAGQIKGQPYFAMEKAGFFDTLGRENVAADLTTAVARSRELLATTAKRPG